MSTASKTYWPVPYIESTFLPHFGKSNLCDNYTIDILLETGAFGTVYRVKDKTGNCYALKVLNKSQVIFYILFILNSWLKIRLSVRF